MDKGANDLKYGLDPNPNAFFSPHNLARVSRELGTLGYKNTELMPLWFQKLDMLIGRPTMDDHIANAKVPFGQAMFGGMKGIVPRHYIYQGFSDSQEFKGHVATLLEYQS